MIMIIITSILLIVLIIFILVLTMFILIIIIFHVVLIILTYPLSPCHPPFFHQQYCYNVHHNIVLNLLMFLQKCPKRRMFIVYPKLKIWLEAELLTDAASVCYVASTVAVHL